MKWLEIGICNNEQLYLEYLHKLLLEIFDKKDINYKITEFLDGQELINFSSNLDAVFLNLEMPVIDGIEIGKVIKRINPECIIIITAGSINRFKEAFKIEAVGYITKPFQPFEVEESVDTILKKFVGIEKIKLFINRNSKNIIQKEIEYARAYNGYVECKCGSQTLRIEKTLKEFYEKLDKRLFFQVNRTYIVNFSIITAYKNGVIVLENEKINVSRRIKKEFELAFIHYDLKYRKGEI